MRSDIMEKKLFEKLQSIKNERTVEFAIFTDGDKTTTEKIVFTIKKMSMGEYNLFVESLDNQKKLETINYIYNMLIVDLLTDIELPTDALETMKMIDVFEQSGLMDSIRKSLYSSDKFLLKEAREKRIKDLGSVLEFIADFDANKAELDIARLADQYEAMPPELKEQVGQVLSKMKE